MNQGNINIFKELKKEFEKSIEVILSDMEKIKSGKDEYIGDIVEYEFRNNIIEVTTEEDGGYGCSYSEYHTYIVPEYYLYNKNWKDEYIEKIKKETEERLKEEEEKELLKLKKKEENERLLFEQLKEKFKDS